MYELFLIAAQKAIFMSYEFQIRGTQLYKHWEEIK